MKIIFYALMILSILSCQGQNDTTNINSIYLSIAPTFDKTNLENQKIISILEQFLKTKNNSLSENEYWLNTDFKKYTYPYLDIYQIEKNKYGDDFFKPNLMELVDISDNKKLLKIGFIGVHPETDERFIKCIYNIVAIKKNENWKLKRAIEYQIKDWQIVKDNSITYYLPQGKIANQTEIQRQVSDIKDLCHFFNTTPINIKYYSCYNPKQVFEIKGFDYSPNMYFGESGGMADPYSNIIYSGNNSEFYTHEVVHIYTKKLFPTINPLLDEGMATYIGGSGNYDYLWHREQLKEYLGISAIDLAEHFNPYERLYINNETPIPYMIGALICERTYRLYGKEELFKLLNSNNELWESLNELGLTKKNLTEQIKEELELIPTTYTKS